jgi:RimJ/RimL family protein N-acetyltransferase
MDSLRLHFRRVNSNDLDNLSSLESNPEVVKFTSMRKPMTRAQTQERLQSLIDKEAERAPLGVWLVETKDNQSLVGWFMLLKTQFEEPELGFMLLPHQWGKGFASEAAQRLLEHAFNDLNIPAVMARIDPDNAASRKVLQKLGFQFWKTELGFDKNLQKDVTTEFYKLARTAGTTFFP